jgi:7-carboxy-7-deazaguanine synthase
MDWANFERLTGTDQVKFVIKDREDYEYARAIVGRERLAARVGAILFSPVHGVLQARQLAEWILADRLPVRLQLQAHKFIWSPDTRGV